MNAENPILPDVDVKLKGNNILITIRNDQIINGLVQKVQGEMGKVIETTTDENGNFILTVDLSDIEDKYNNEFSNRFGLNGKFLEIENRIVKVKINREATRLMLEKLFKGMTVLDYKDRFEISGTIDVSTLPAGFGGNMPFKM